MRYFSVPLALAALGLALGGCATDFDSYEEILTPRVLAVGAEPSTLIPGATTTLSTFVTEPASATYQWSWCPFVGGSSEGYPCLVPQDALQTAIDDLLGAGTVTVPDYDLGTGATATLTHVIPPLVLQAFCDLLQGGMLPDPVDFPDCSRAFEIDVRVEVVQQGVTIEARRELDLLYDVDDPINTTPTILGLTAIHDVTGAVIVLDPAAPTQLTRNTTYQLVADVSEADSETYEKVPLQGGPAETVRESVRISWFYQGGDLDRRATGFIDDGSPFADALENEWRTPTIEERSDDTARLFLVIRDDRGGTSWIERTVELLP